MNSIHLYLYSAKPHPQTSPEQINGKQKRERENQLDGTMGGKNFPVGWWIHFHIRSIFLLIVTHLQQTLVMWQHVWGIPVERLLSHDRLTSSLVTRTTSGSQTSYLSVSNWACLRVSSGGGGNFVLSSSLVGYTTVLGAVAPMVRHGYGFFYRIRDDRWARSFWRFLTAFHSVQRRSKGQRRRTEPITAQTGSFSSSLTSGSSSRSQRGNPAATLMPCRCSTASPVPCTRCTTWPPHLNCSLMEQ